MGTYWKNISDTQIPEKETLAKKLNIHPLLASLLIKRGIKTFEEARDFFNPILENLHDPFLMKDMDKAVSRLSSAMRQKEKVLIYGDYDVDGTTAVTLVYSFLKSLGMDCEYYIPDRYKEGYGFSMDGVEWAKANAVSLIITLDCGIKDGIRIAKAGEYGMDVIVCDHHNPGELPPAFAILDPKREDCPYPFKGLSGCGVGFKMLQAFCRKEMLDESPLMDALDLVMISIGADIVPLSGENRVLAFHGLKRIEAFKRPGIQAMLRQAKFEKEKLTITDVVFILAPRINAAGRIFSGKRAVELLLTTNEEDAKNISEALEENNDTRKGLDKLITKEAVQLISGDDFYRTSFSTVVNGDGWHKGVVGIVASRLVDEFHKPAIVLVTSGEKMTGSARSINGVDLYDILSECHDLLEQFGGHTMAAGLSLRTENFSAFRDRFDKLVKKALGEVLLEPSIEFEEEIQLADIDEKFFRILQRFAPFGPENMKPVFLSSGVRNAGYTRTVGDTGAHLKLHVTQDGRQTPMDGIGFDLGDWATLLQSGEKTDILYTIEDNTWKNRTSIQLNVKDIRIS